MKKFSAAIILITLLNNLIFSQEAYFKSYNWGTPEWIECSSEEPKTIIKKQEIIEFDFEGDNYNEYYIRHVIEYLNNDDELQNNNKKYIPYNNRSEIVKAKARVIKRNNVVIELDESKILESSDEETGRMYKYFALDGLETGDVVEVLYILKRYPNIYGTYIIFQEEYPISDYAFDLIAPNYLEFAFDLKNDSSQIIADTTIKGRIHYSLNVSPVPKLKNEESAPYNELLKRLTYKLDKNSAKGTKNIVSYEEASRNIYSRIYTVDKIDSKSLNNFAKKIKLTTNASDSAKIRAIEDYVKANINIIEDGDSRFDNINFVISNKTASPFGIAKLLANIFKTFSIEHQIVLTTDRSAIPFDKDFVSYHNLSKYLLYFPNPDMFICPDKFECRGSLIPAEYANNYGLFIQEMALGEFKSGIGNIQYIPPLPYNRTHHNMNLNAVINADFSEVSIDLIQSSLGYYASYLQSLLELLGEDVYNDLGKRVINNTIENLEPESWEFKNVGAINIDKEPLLLVCKGKNNSLMDYAGENYLFKVGQLIGPQVELYSESERTLPINDDYKREFNRTLKISIPEGYEVENAEDLKIFADYKKNGKQVLLFESNYTIDGKTITITINEFYDQVSYDLSVYPIYRKVVNSASDFNKVILVIGKKADE